MGSRVSREDFEWVDTDEPHAQRKREILGEVLCICSRVCSVATAQALNRRRGLGRLRVLTALGMHGTSPIPKTYYLFGEEAQARP